MFVNVNGKSVGACCSWCGTFNSWIAYCPEDEKQAECKRCKEVFYPKTVDKEEE